MSSPTPLDHPDQDAELARLLRDRADSIHPLGTSPSQLARRAGRVRHRRRATAAGLGLAATAVVASVVVTRPTSDDSQQVETRVADAPDPTGPPSEPSTGDALVFPPVTWTTVPEAGGPPVRLGLDVAGGEVTDAGAWESGETTHTLPTGVHVDFVDPSGGRGISVTAVFANDLLMGNDAAQLAGPGSEQVDLGGGVTGVLTRTPVPLLEVPGYLTAEVTLSFEIEGSPVHMSGLGVTDDELTRAARGIGIAADPALVVGWIPDDLAPAEPRNPIVGGASGSGSIVSYALADGLSVSIKVSSDAGGGIDHDLEATRTAPTPTQYLRTVRGSDAIVRRAAGMTSVVWREPSGHLVEVYIGPGPSLDPATIPDESIVDAVVDLDESTFQDLVAAHPVTTVHP